jgi:hypothetical protein
MDFDRTRRTGVAASVLLGHALVLWVLLREFKHEAPLNDTRSSSVLFFLPAPRPQAPPVEIQSAPKTSSALSLPTKPSIAPSARADNAPSNQAATPHLDWRAEAREAAQAALEEDERAKSKKFAEGSEPRREKCHKLKPPEWRPEPKRFGVANGLPFVRLGERCVIGLGFFGCGFGKKPPADWHLFDEMQSDPTASSVPALSDCVE